MSSQPKSLEWADLLCDKGLAKREGLLKFLQGAKHDEVDGLIDSRDVLQIRYDEGVIREVFNARYSSVQPMDARTKKQQIETRSAFLLVVYRLYAAGRARTPAELRRPLQPTEVQTAIA